MPMLTITDDDRTLAAELGLLLIREAVSARDQQLAADPRATRVPENWLVKTTDTKRLVGRLHFTPVDCLYASKLATGVSGIEESVADALRWIAPILRHVRTGEHDGTETVVLHAQGKIWDRPRALTECGAKATGADYNKIGARSAIVNGEAGEMCPACRRALEARGIRDHAQLPGRRGTSTGKQQDFIRRLVDEAARCGRPYLLETRGIEQLSCREASATIDALQILKARNWKGELAL